MEWVALIIAVGALVLSIWALKRTGGLTDMRTKVDSLSSLGLTEMKKQVESKTESFREKTADILDQLEKRVRGKNTKKNDLPKGEDEGKPGGGEMTPV